MPAGVEFEQGRLYVEARQSVLFFARIGEQRLRCYVTRDALAQHFGAQSETANAYKYCLRAYDRNAELIHEVARQLIAAKRYAPDGAVIVIPEAIEEHVAQAA
jgi:Protein of unknown function (DUF1488)